MKIKSEDIKVVQAILDHLKTRSGLDIILCQCIDCGTIYDAKLGEGTNGISSGYCFPCSVKVRAKNRLELREMEKKIQVQYE